MRVVGFSWLEAHTRCRWVLLRGRGVDQEFFAGYESQDVSGRFGVSLYAVYADIDVGVSWEPTVPLETMDMMYSSGPGSYSVPRGQLWSRDLACHLFRRHEHRPFPVSGLVSEEVR